MACPAAATRNDQCVSSAGVSSLRSQTSRGGLTSRLPPSSRPSRAAPFSGRTRCPPQQLNRIRLKPVLLEKSSVAGSPDKRQLRRAAPLFSPSCGTGGATRSRAAASLFKSEATGRRQHETFHTISHAICRADHGQRQRTTESAFGHRNQSKNRHRYSGQTGNRFTLRRQRKPGRKRQLRQRAYSARLACAAGGRSVWG